MRTTRNIAARAGRWSAQHRKIAIFGWLAFVIVAVLIGKAIGTNHLGSSQTSRTGESGRADAVLRSTFQRNYSEQVLVQARTGAAAKDVSRGVGNVVQRLQATGDATNIRSPFAPGNSGQLSEGGRSALVTFEVKGTAGDEQYTKIDKVDPLLAATAAASRAHPSLRIEQFGDASVNKAVNKSISEDFAKAQKLSLPITLLILVVAFGALVAAGVPAAAGAHRRDGTLGLVAVRATSSRWTRRSARVILLIGLAVGVDYSLFYLRREREERAAGASKRGRDRRRGRHLRPRGPHLRAHRHGRDGRHVLRRRPHVHVVRHRDDHGRRRRDDRLDHRAARDARRLGDRVEKGRVPFIGRRRRSAAESRVWAAPRPVLRPGHLAAVATALLVALTMPAFGMHTVQLGHRRHSRKTCPIMRSYDRMQAAFPGGCEPAPSWSSRRRDVSPGGPGRDQASSSDGALGDRPR